MASKNAGTVFDGVTDKKEKEDNDKDKDETNTVIVPFYDTALGALDTLKCFLQNADVASNIMMHFNALKKFIVQTRQKQMNIDDLFKKNESAFFFV